MKYYSEPKKDIPIHSSVDVLVIGGGPAGVAAAISAARTGAKTMLIEQSGDVGGVATTGLMSHWTGKATGPLYEEILGKGQDRDTLKDMSAYSTWAATHTINPEILKTTLLGMLWECGVQLKLYTFACDAIVENDVIQGVIIESKSGREAVLSKIVIDASGDGDIAAKAGAPFYKGREDDGRMQPVTLMFKVAGVEEERVLGFPGGFEDTLELPKGEIQALGRSHLTSPAGHVLLYRTTLPGVVTLNMTNCTGIDGTNADDLTAATYRCRQQMNEIVAFLREFVPGFEKCYPISSASIIGVRETRHFVGEYTLTKDDILQAREFEDWVVTKAHFNFDVHNITGSGLDATGVQKFFPQKKEYTIPWGCFVPQKIDNLLLAGRNISGTHMAHASYRVMPICVNMGQAVGTAAALCAASDTLPRSIDVKLIQKALMEQGVQI